MLTTRNNISNILGIYVDFAWRRKPQLDEGGIRDNAETYCCLSPLIKYDNEHPAGINDQSGNI